MGRLLTALAAILLSLTACSSDDDKPSEATQAACSTEYRVVNAASMAYQADTGTPPADTQALVTDGYLDTTPDHWAVNDGTISLTAEGEDQGCTKPD
jgi:hypothetical protein